MSYQGRIQEKQKLERQEKLRRVLKTAFISLGATVAGGLSLWLLLRTNSVNEEELISAAGIHWHPELSIYIHGEKQVIPADIGIGAVHNPIHTHDDTGVIHLEFNGQVTKRQITLGNFFKIWGKKFNKDCIFYSGGGPGGRGESCNGSEGQVKMFVNGAPSNEFENYVMKDGDKIEIRSE